MKHYRLHELAKFLSGVVLADLITEIWLWSSGMLPLSILGVTLTEEMLPAVITFDIALFIVLVYYGWHIGKLPAVREKSYLLIVGAVFALITLEHLARVLFGYEAVLGDWTVPVWLSWLGVAIAAYLSYMSFHLAARVKR